jgi:hypothetical protein
MQAPQCHAAGGPPGRRSCQPSRRDLELPGQLLNEPPASEPSLQDLIDALNRPVDATAIAITASVARAGNSVKLTEAIDLAGLDLHLTEGTWKGKAEVVTRFIAVDGTQAGEVVSDTLMLNLRPATYQSMLGSGVLDSKGLAIPERAVELKLLVGNLASGKIGTLTIPLPNTKKILGEEVRFDA